MSCPSCGADLDTDNRCGECGHRTSRGMGTPLGGDTVCAIKYGDYSFETWWRRIRRLRAKEQTP